MTPFGGLSGRSGHRTYQSVVRICDFLQIQAALSSSHPAELWPHGVSPRYRAYQCDLRLRFTKGVRGVGEGCPGPEYLSLLLSEIYRDKSKHI